MLGMVRYGSAVVDCRSGCTDGEQNTLHADDGIRPLRKQKLRVRMILRGTRLPLIKVLLRALLADPLHPAHYTMHHDKTPPEHLGEQPPRPPARDDPY